MVRHLPPSCQGRQFNFGCSYHRIKEVGRDFPDVSCVAVDLVPMKECVSFYIFIGAADETNFSLQ